MKLIGMIHLKTLPGYPQHKNMDFVINAALDDAKKLEMGGVDALLIENTDDDPHQKEVSRETIAAFTAVSLHIKEKTKVPIGICVLWNDYKASLAIAKVVGAAFVRIPVFTEAVLTASGFIEGNPYDVISYREKIKALDIKILADIHVKHASHLSTRSIQESAIEALHFGADEIIITGKFTGDKPTLHDLQQVRTACPSSTIIVGSGTTSENIKEIKLYVHRFIVGTYFKNEKNEIDIAKVRHLKSLL